MELPYLGYSMYNWKISINEFLGLTKTNSEKGLFPLYTYTYFKNSWSGAMVNAMTERNCGLSKCSIIIKILRYETWILDESGN